MATVKLERWRGHLMAARERGMPLSHYAREQGISPHALYAAQRKLRRQAGDVVRQRAGRARVAAEASPFVAVHVAEPKAAAMRARLPNGVELEFGQLDVMAYETLVRLLAALPCSA